MLGITTTSLLEVSGSTALIYLVLLVALRVAGRRQLDQLSVVDLTVVLVLGSAVETAMIHGNVTLAAGITSAATLLLVNRALTWLFLRSKRLRHLVGGGPVLLVHDGVPVDSHLRRVGMTPADLLEAVRGRGYASLAEVRAAVLETDGTVSVLTRHTMNEDRAS